MATDVEASWGASWAAAGAGVKSAKTLALMVSAEELACALSTLTPPAPTAPVADHTQHLQAVRDCTRQLSPIVAQHLQISGAANDALEATMKACTEARKAHEEAKVRLQAAQDALAEASAALATAEQVDEQASATQKAECEASGRLFVIKGTADGMAAAADAALQAAMAAAADAALQAAKTAPQAAEPLARPPSQPSQPKPAATPAVPAAVGAKRSHDEAASSEGGSLRMKLDAIRDELEISPELKTSATLRAACTQLKLDFSSYDSIQSAADAVMKQLGI